MIGLNSNKNVKVLTLIRKFKFSKLSLFSFKFHSIPALELGHFVNTKNCRTAKKRKNKQDVKTYGVYFSWASTDSADYDLHLFGFHEFINSLEVYDGVVDKGLSYLSVNLNRFKSLKEISLFYIWLIPDLCEKILPQMEIVRLNNCELFDEFYKDFLQFCPNLKEIEVVDTYRMLNPYKNPWLLRTYPLLEVVHFHPYKAFKIKELRKFFENNSNIRTFVTRSDVLWENRKDLLQSNIKLDRLKISHYSTGTRNMDLDIQPFRELLRQLYNRGFYKRLHFSMKLFDKDDAEYFRSFDALESLRVENLAANLVPQKTVRYLEIDHNYDHFVNVPAKIFPNVENLILGNTNFENLLKIVGELKYLKRIKIKVFEGHLNLIVLNGEREKFRGAHKVTIFVADETFIKTKRSTKNGNTNLNLVEIKREHAL